MSEKPNIPACPGCGAPGPLESIGADEHSAWHTTHFCDPYELGSQIRKREQTLASVARKLLAAALMGRRRLDIDADGGLVCDAFVFLTPEEAIAADYAVAEYLSSEATA